MLNFSEFLLYLQENLVQTLPEELKGAKIDVNVVEKNNGLVLHAITVKPENSNIAPNVYVDDYFVQYEEGRALEDILEAFTSTVVKNIAAPEEFKNIAEDFRDFEFVKDKIIMSVVNTERNTNLLEQIPHENREDLSIIYKVLLKSDKAGMACVTIRNEHLDMWGVDVERIHALAMENTKELFPVTVRTMDDIMREMFMKDGMPEEIAKLMMEDRPAKEQMYVITNSQQQNGAVSMFYLDELSKLSETVGTDLYLLPSSIHEVIAVSAEMGTPQELSAMVRDVNGSQVVAEEQLSDHVYRFQAKTKTLSLADTTMEQLEMEKRQTANFRNRQHR